ncbi:hypothetical protein EIL50_00460 [bacterium NHP-B]|nr:hypothetical protein EIL50_00460 [bacterium NHP-B]
MPQLDVATYSSQLFWLFVSFGILWLGLWQLLPSMGRVFASRKARIQSLVAKARTLEQQAEDILALQASHVERERRKVKKNVEEALVATHEEIRQERHALAEASAAELHKAAKDLEKKMAAQLRDIEPLTQKMATSLWQKAHQAYQRQT